jgi:hypothetical protein
MTLNDFLNEPRMAAQLSKLGQRPGFDSAAAFAQRLISFVLDHSKKLLLDASETAPLSKSFQLFADARKDLSGPFRSVHDGMQSCVYDVLLCSASFWGQVFEYYETMYFKAVQLPDGTVEISPATVSFEAGWKIACLFIRENLLSLAGKAAGVSSGFDKSLNWCFYPANLGKELEDAKVMVLTLIGQIRKRGTVLVAAEGILGSMSFTFTIPLKLWVDDKLDKDWNNVTRLDALCQEYFESSSIRLNVTLKAPPDDANASFLPSFASDFVDGSTLTPRNSLAAADRSVALNIRPIPPFVFASPGCEWSGVGMGEFCREVPHQCVWPEVVNTVPPTEDQIGMSALKVSASLTARALANSPSRWPVPPSPTDLSFSSVEEKMPHLEPIFGVEESAYVPSIRRASVSPKSTGHASTAVPGLTPTPQRLSMDSDVKCKNSSHSPVSTESDVEFESPNKIRRVSSGPDPETISPVSESSRSSLKDIVKQIVFAAKREVSSNDWSLCAALGELLKHSDTLSSLYTFVLHSGGAESFSKAYKEQEPPGRRSSRLRLSNSSKEICESLPKISDSVLANCEAYLAYLMKFTQKNVLRDLRREGSRFTALARVLALAHVLDQGDWSEDAMKMVVSVAGDFVCYCLKIKAHIRPTDIYAAGLRRAYADAGIAMIEVAKGLKFGDWLSLALFYDDFAYTVLMGEEGLFAVSHAADTDGVHRVGREDTLRLGLNSHCLLVGSELVNRWSFHMTSSFWDILRALTSEFINRRHDWEPKVERFQRSSESIKKLDKFLRILLVDSSLYLLDLCACMHLPLIVQHAAFDLVRSVILLRPVLLRGRHMHQIVQCSIVAASVLFTSPPYRPSFQQLGFVAKERQTSAEAQLIYSQFVLDAVLLSTAGGDVLFSDAGAAIAWSPELHPDSELTGSVEDFYVKEFVSEMRQVLFNLHRSKLGSACWESGPFPERKTQCQSVSPLSYIALSSWMVLAFQIAFGDAYAARGIFPASKFVVAFPFAFPLGVIPCLLPPIEAWELSLVESRRIFVNWVPGTAISTKGIGEYSVSCAEDS